MEESGSVPGTHGTLWGGGILGASHPLACPPTCAPVCDSSVRLRRPLQILLGDEGYTEAIDLWAVGCVLGELLTGKPIFPGTSEQQTLERIGDLLGQPNDVRA